MQQSAQSHCGCRISGGQIFQRLLAKLLADVALRLVQQESALAAIFKAAMELIGGIKDGTLVSVDLLPVFIGMLTAAVCGYIAIKFMLKVIKKANYKWFSIYLVGISIATLITYLV